MRNSIILFCLAIPFMVCCKRDNEVVDNQPLRVVSFMETNKTKVDYISDNGSLVPGWEAGDVISIYWGQKTYYYIAKDSGSQTEFIPATDSDTLSGIPDGTIIYCFYPRVDIVDNKVLVSNLEADTFIYEKEDRVVFPYNYMRGVGQVKKGVLSIGFRHIFSYIKLLVSKDLVGPTSYGGIRLKFNTYELLSYSIKYDIESQQFIERQSAWWNQWTAWHLLYAKEQSGPIIKGYLYYPVIPGEYKNLDIEVYVKNDPNFTYHTDFIEFLPNRIYVLDPVKSIMYDTEGGISDMSVINW